MIPTTNQGGVLFFLHPPQSSDEPHWVLQLTCKESRYFPRQKTRFDMTVSEDLARFLFEEVRAGYSRDGSYDFTETAPDTWEGVCEATGEVIELVLMRE